MFPRVIIEKEAMGKILIVAMATKLNPTYKLYNIQLIKMRILKLSRFFCNLYLSRKFDEIIKNLISTHNDIKPFLSSQEKTHISERQVKIYFV